MDDLEHVARLDRDAAVLRARHHLAVALDHLRAADVRLDQVLQGRRRRRPAEDLVEGARPGPEVRRVLVGGLVEGARLVRAERKS